MDVVDRHVYVFAVDRPWADVFVTDLLRLQPSAHVAAQFATMDEEVH